MLMPRHTPHPPRPPPPCTCLSRYEQSQVHLLIIYFCKIVKPQQSLWASWLQNGLGMGLPGESGFCLKYNSIHLSFRSHWKKMNIGNRSLVTEFILVGLTEHPEIQEPLFFLFLGIYIITMAGNLGLVTINRLTSHLHTPCTTSFLIYSILVSVTLLSSPPSCW